MIKLSILILTTPRRRAGCFQRLLDNLEGQTQGKPVEIIGLYDNKQRTVGAKRNAALSLAQGEYVAFIDDDDSVAPDYVDAILACIEKNPGVDVIVFHCITTIHDMQGNVKEKHYSRYSKDYEYTITPESDINGFRQWTGKPAHTCIHRSENAKSCAFPDKQYSEDVDFCVKVAEKIKTEAKIEKVLYYYDFKPSTSETRQ